MARSSCAEGVCRFACAASFALAACVDTSETAPAGVDSQGNPLPPSGVPDPNLPSSSPDPNLPDAPRPTADCSDYPSDGPEPATAAPMTDPVPAGALPEGPSGPYAWQNVTIKGGGFVSGIVFSTAAPHLVYARTDVGGAYRYDVALERWRPITDWVASNESNLMGIESIAADPVAPNRVYLAAGTYLSAGDGLIFSSSDYGQTFERHGIGVPMGGNANGRSMGERLAIDPNQPTTLYFGSRNDGLLVSHDSAVSWQPVAGFPVLGALDLGLSFVLFDARDGSAGQPTRTIYVGVARLANDDVTAIANAGNDSRNPSDALFRSTDAGQTWQPVPGQPLAMMPHHAAL
ncbi:MAG TPA: hypothetical protein VMG12_24420, partial [Polyangiaceae bacterium]|nr:hypothetical protein [Polyangiaceae bacterium]